MKLWSWTSSLGDVQVLMHIHSRWRGASIGWAVDLVWALIHRLSPRMYPLLLVHFFGASWDEMMAKLAQVGDARLHL